MQLCKYVLILIIILAYCFGRQIPASWGWENGPLEWLQVVILSIGALLSGKWWHEAKTDRQQHCARFFAWSIPLWLLMVGRELSWGRVFFPVGINPASGPFFAPVSQLPYGPVVYPAIATVILFWLFAVIRYKLWKIPYTLYRQDRFPAGDFLLVIFSFLLAHFAERMLHFMILEEIGETVAYLALMLTAYRVKIAIQQLTDKLSNRRRSFYNVRL